jgi:hypothetical protein
MSDEYHGSPHGYGTINEPESRFLESIVTRAAAILQNRVKFLEVGIACGYTGRGIANFCKGKGIAIEYHGIDGESGKPHPGVLPDGGTFHLGDSTEIFESIPDGFHVIFIDACHCNNHVILDFCNYSPKVVVGGFVVFHDTNPNMIWQGFHEAYWQGHGPKTAAFCIATQQALSKLGLLNGHRTDWAPAGIEHSGDMLGMTAFKKLYP